MRRLWARIWPAAELAEARQRIVQLQNQLETTSVSARNANERAVNAQERLDELRSRECPTCLVLKQTCNSLMFASGSRLPMFEDVGPTLPAMVNKPTDMMPVGKRRASDLVRENNRNFLEEFAKEQARMAQELAENPQEQAS